MDTLKLHISMVLKASVFYCSFQETFHQLQNYVFLFIKDINQTTDANPTESDIDWLIYRSQNLLKVLETGQLLYPCTRQHLIVGGLNKKRRVLANRLKLSD